VAHFPKPFFRTARNAWFVQVGDRQVKLATDKESAFKRYHELMCQPLKAVAAQPAATTARLVIVIVDEFLEWCQKHRAPDTYRWYKDRLNVFCNSIPADLTTEQLKPHHVQKWVDAQDNLASGSRRNLIASVKRAMRWAEEQGYVERSPIALMRKPACGRKEQVVSLTEYEEILDRIEFDSHRMPCAQGFLESVADSIEMPLGYAYKLDYGLFRENFERRKEHYCKAVTVCCNRDIAVNLVPDAGYRPAHTVDVLHGFTDLNFWNLQEARVSDRGVEINYIEPGCTVAPEPGDDVEIGIRISNSETGYVGLKASLSTLRLVCTNGAVMTDHLGTARWNYDPRVKYSTSIDQFNTALIKLRGRQGLLADLYKQPLRRNLLDTELVNLHRRLRASLPAAAVDAVLGLGLEERQAVQASVRSRSREMPAAPTTHHLWDVHNQITAAAQRLDFVRRSRLERIGGALLVNGSMN
jgi:hypothetical protein